MKNTIPYRMSEKNIKFLRRINENSYKADKIPFKKISLDRIISHIRTFFELDNESYLRLLDVVGKGEVKKNG